MTRVALLGLLAWWPFLHSGCVDINGGAIELSWSLRTTAGVSTDCGDARIADMELHWTLPDGGQDSRSFPCDPPRAATRFEIPPGTASIWLQPLCENGTTPAAGTYEAPAAIDRTVVEGEIVTLNALLVVVRLDDCSSEACVCR